MHLYKGGSHVLLQPSNSAVRFLVSMDFLPFSFEILLVGTLFLILLVKIGKRRETNGAALLLPPGPSKLPIIGSMHHLLGSLPHPTLRDLAKKYGDVMHLQLGEVSTLVISSTEFAREVLVTNHANFASRPSLLAAEIMTYNCTDIGFAPYGEYWRNLRKICNLELLSAKRVTSFWPIRKQELSELMNVIASKEGSLVNFSREVDTSIHAITAIAAFGKKCQEHEQFIDIAKEFSRIAGGFNIADMYPSAKWLHYLTGLRTKLMKLRGQGDWIMEKIMDQHKMKKARKGKDGEAETEDLVDVLLRYQHPNGNEDNFYLTEENIKAIILDMFTAGGDTSGGVIEWAMSELMKNPRVMTKAQTEVREVFDKVCEVDEIGISDLHYLKLVVKETMRLHPPGPLLLPRESAQACKIDGYDIPMKSQILVNAWAIGRDPRYWTDPESFYPERFSVDSMDYRGTSLEYIPFGAGRRMCPGVTFGVSTVETVLAFCLYHFDWKFPEGVKAEELDMTERFGAVVRRKHDLELIPIMHRPLA